MVSIPILAAAMFISSLLGVWFGFSIPRKK